jgi:hypothetical protein
VKADRLAEARLQVTPGELGDAHFVLERPDLQSQVFDIERQQRSGDFGDQGISRGQESGFRIRG